MDIKLMMMTTTTAATTTTMMAFFNFQFNIQYSNQTMSGGKVMKSVFSNTVYTCYDDRTCIYEFVLMMVCSKLLSDYYY